MVGRTTEANGELEPPRRPLTQEQLFLEAAIAEIKATGIKAGSPMVDGPPSNIGEQDA